MKRLVIQTTQFSSTLDNLIKKRKLNKEDYILFEYSLISDPEQGDLVKGSGGIRKTRLRSSTKGKSSSFRVYYYDIAVKERLYLLVLFAKNVKEDLSSKEKKWCRSYIQQLREELKI
jgi:hypothetical protein